jgi:diadenylate cyclase
MSRNLIGRGDVAVCLSGEAGSGSLDTLVVIDVDEDFELVSRAGFAHPFPSSVQPEGREGKPVGTLFVVGDTDRVLSHSRPLISNPFRGYREDERNVLCAGLEETVKELALLDGAFVVRGDGVIETCGVLPGPASRRTRSFRKGSGRDTTAAASITRLCRPG